MLLNRAKVFEVEKILIQIQFIKYWEILHKGDNFNMEAY